MICQLGDFQSNYLNQNQEKDMSNLDADNCTSVRDLMMYDCQNNVMNVTGLELLEQGWATHLKNCSNTNAKRKTTHLPAPNTEPGLISWVNHADILENIIVSQHFGMESERLKLCRESKRKWRHVFIKTLTDRRYLFNEIKNNWTWYKF